MPVIRPRATQEQPQREERLVEQLAEDLRATPAPDAPMRQPLIIEEPLGQTNTLHVTVIWEHWRLIDAGRRSRVILAAYEQAAPDRVDQITIAMGATVEEAIDLGLLPYGIEPALLDGEQSLGGKEVALMQAEGAVTTPGGIILRFPTHEMAKLAYERLVAKTSPARWSLVHYPRNQR